MHPSAFCYMVAFALGIASYWVGKLTGPAIAALALGLFVASRF